MVERHDAIFQSLEIGEPTDSGARLLIEAGECEYRHGDWRLQADQGRYCRKQPGKPEPKIGLEQQVEISLM